MSDEKKELPAPGMTKVVVNRTVSDVPVDPRLAALRARQGAVTVEEWAEAKGMFPEFSTAPAGRTGKSTKQVHNRAFGAFAAARGLHSWLANSEVTEAQFDAAVAKASDPTQNTFR